MSRSSARPAYPASPATSSPSFAGTSSSTIAGDAPPPPLRPERSLRRPGGASPSPAALRNGNDWLDSLPNSPSLSPNPAASSASSTTHPFASSSRLAPASAYGYPHMRRDDEFDTASDSSSRPASPSGSNAPADSPSLVVPSALSDAISAFSSAGRRRADGRRGGLADQGFDVPSQRKGSAATGGGGARGKSSGGAGSALNPAEYPDTPAFREVDEVLRKVQAEWPALVRGTSLAGQPVDDDSAFGGGSDEFDPVSLALHLLNPAPTPARSDRDPPSSASAGAAGGGRQSLSSFLRLKAELDHAIRSTLSPATNPSPSSSNAYRAYETSITTHNSTLAALGAAQRQIGDLRSGLGMTRERLEGKGREGLAGMYARMGMLEEMGGVLDEIDHLLRLPPSLESLLSEKRFLSAVVLLVRSIKTLNKPEMQEIGALADLRAWAKGQETVLLEILIEELHNHLYLKSFYCDVRWKSYTRGQTDLPLVDFGDDAEQPPSIPSHLAASFHTSGRSTARLPRMSKLQRYLHSLALKPSSNPMLDEPVDELMLDPHEAEDDSLGGFGSLSFGAGETFGSLAEAGSGGGGGGAGGEGGGGGAGSGGTKERQGQRRRNPEVDSFAYIEMLMEALAALGKLGYALDAVGQRVQGEMFALVESTVEEVEERSDQNRPYSTAGGAAGGSASSSSTTRPPSSAFLLFSPSSPNPGALTSATAAGSWAAEGVASLLRLSASETSSLASSVETLRDLFWTLYSKLDAVLQGFRVAYEVAGRIADRRDFKDTSIVKTSSGNLLFSLLDVWKPVQQEVRALLHDYLTDDQSGTVSSRNPIVSVNEVLRFPKPRDSSKQIFKFSDSDFEASSKLLKAHEDSLNRALKAAVPGLITNGAPSTTTTSALIVASTDPSAGGGGGRASGLNGTHKALVPADAFNVSVLFGPTLAFLERVKEIMPGGLVGDDETTASTSFGGFLDEFVLRTFLPQLEDKVASVFHQAVGGIDAFQEDPNYKRVSKVPIVRSVSNLMLLISSLCSMLRATPFHRENYSQLIVSVIHQFYQRCLERFKDLAARETHDTASTTNGSNGPAGQTAQLKTAAAWAETPELHACLAELRSASGTDPVKLRETLAKETKLELDKKRNGVVASEDLISPSKRLWALGTLYSSLDWFIHHVSSLKTSTEAAPPTMLNGFAGAFGGRRPRESGYSSSDGSPALGSRDEVDEAEEREDGFALPLTSEMTRPFEALLKSYRQLADVVLFTLRLEIRLRTMHYLDKATRDGVYQLAEDIQEPDPSVVDLNGDLAECDECAAGTLGESERKFIFEGLSLLMDQLLISNARHIRLANEFGLSKMMRNILALQQNLKNIGDSPLDVDFDRSRKFWELFGKGPRAMLDAIQAGAVHYQFDDYKALLQLQLQIDQSGKDSASAVTSNGGGTDSMVVSLSSATSDKNRRLYGEYMIELFSLDHGNEADD
ncbi:hypothetical protein JCM5296_007207 [Sporobolomyces johnsonii]